MSTSSRATGSMPEADPRAARGLTRRELLAGSAALGGGALLGPVACARPPRPHRDYLLDRAEHQIYSVCLQCHTACPIKVKVVDGVAVKIDGNPFSTQTLSRPLDADTSLARAAAVDGKICPKGQAGIQSLYDPYRITRVLKRAGRRGENRWRSIPFEQAIREIAEGGRLFADVPGEEEREVPGLRELFKLRDPALAKRLAEDARAVARGELSSEEFRARHAEHLGVLIDRERPDLGPVNNQLVFLAGRIEHGRKEFSKRWLKGGFGSVNWYEHTTICEQSHHIAFEKITAPWMGDSWGKGKHHLKPDLYGSEFVIFFGTSPFEANFGPPILAEQITRATTEGRLRIAVVDPRLNKTAGKAWRWVPIRPGGDAAFAYALARRILDRGGHDARFLGNANRAAAAADGEPSWTNATWLVRIEEDGPGALLRGSDVGLGTEGSFVAIRDGAPVAVDPNDPSTPVEGELDYDGEVAGIRVKTAFQLYRELVESRTVEQWCELCGADPERARELADEFIRHGKRSVADFYRGPVQHTAGYYNAQAIISLNLLAGNPDWKGGLTQGGGHWHEDGSKPGQPFPLVQDLHPGALTAFGHKLTREGSHYEESSFFRTDGYPARRPWFPHTGNVYQEVLPSAEDGYPYPIRALFLHKGTPVFSTPGGHAMIPFLADPERLPLFIACDIVIGESSMYADYLFPDTAVWERWGTPHQTPAAPVAGSKVRQPTVDPLVERGEVFGRRIPISMEAVMLALAEALGLPGYGADGFGRGMPLEAPEDFYLKMVANIAAGDRPGDAVPDADDAEVELFARARAHLSPAVFDRGRWERATRDASGRSWWRKAVFVLNRGGRFEEFGVYQRSGRYVPRKFGGLFQLYVEDVALTRDSHSGRRFSGIAPVLPVLAFDGSPVEDADHPLALITYKHIAGGQSRTLADAWLGRIWPENEVLVHARTAARLGLREGDRVRLVSASNPDGVWDLANGEQVEVAGPVRPVQGIHPDVVAVSWHYGHWAYGSRDVEVDGRRIAGDPARGTGLCPNAVFRLDPALRNVCLQDPIGGSASFYDTRISLVRAQTVR